MSWLLLIVSAVGGSVQASESFALKTVWTATSGVQPLKSWSLDELAKLKQISSNERDRATGKMVNWKGVQLSSFVEKALSELPLEQRASVDLIVVRAGTGVQSVIPRSLVTKYPVLLATQKNRKSLENEGPLAVVVPATSVPKISGEGLPVSAYDLTGVTEIELANYQARYQGYFLKRRTDPAAIRGEKMYVQNCISCHEAGRARVINEVASSAPSRSIASAGHSDKAGAPKLTDRDLRALVSYLDSYRSEKALAETTKTAKK